MKIKKYIKTYQSGQKNNIQDQAFQKLLVYQNLKYASTCVTYKKFGNFNTSKLL